MKLKHKSWRTLLGSLFVLLMMVMTACGTSPAQTSSEASSGELESASEVVTESAETSGTEETAPLRLAALKGPTSMGLAQLMTQAQEKKAPYEVQILGSPDAVAPLLVKKEIDVAALPSNMAALLYQKTKGDLVVLNVNTLGVLYLMSTDTQIQTMGDLQGKTILASGKGTTPEFVLNFLLEKNGLSSDDVTVEWKSEHTEVLSALAQQPDAVALLPEPFATTAEAKMPDLHRVVDLNTSWDEMTGASSSDPGSSLVMGVLVARREVVEQHPEQIQQLIRDARSSVDFVNANPEQAGEQIGALGIVPGELAQKAIPHAHLVHLEGETMKTQLQGFLQVLFDQNPALIGGTMPGDDFYYTDPVQ